MTKPATLPVDLTGSSSNNLITNEFQQISGGAVGIIRPEYGAFFSDSMHLYSVDGLNNQTELTKGVDYKVSEIDIAATESSGKPVYNSLVILNTYLPSTFSLNYQAFGGSKAGNRAMAVFATKSNADGQPLDYSQVYNKPDGFSPSSHTHDIADVYGMEYVLNELNGVFQAIKGNNTIGADAEITQQLFSLDSVAHDYWEALLKAMDAHMNPDYYIAQYGNSTPVYRHANMKQMVKLGNVQNYGFSATTAPDGSQNPIYASPATIRAALLSLPTRDMVAYTAHLAAANPHNTTANNLNLGNVINKPFQAVSYTNGYANYNNTFGLSHLPASTADGYTSWSYYVSDYQFKYALDELLSDWYNVNATIASYALYNPNTNTGSIVNLQNAKSTMESNLATLSSNQVAATLAVSTFGSLVANANRKVQRARLVNKNAVFAQTMIQLIGYDASRMSSGLSVLDNAIWPGPKYLEGLELWVSSDYSGNEVVTDLIGNRRVLSLVDRSKNGRVFRSPLISTAPVLGPSRDNSTSAIGINYQDTLHFENGQFYQLKDGTPLLLRPGMTVIALVRSNQNAGMTLLTDMSNLNAVGLFDPISHDIVKVKTQGSWNPISSVSYDSTLPHSSVVILSVARLSEAECWVDSSDPLNFTTKSRGTSSITPNWPTPDFLGYPMNLIGHPNSAVANSGELAELLVFSRQLSVMEIKAVLAYIRLNSSHNNAFDVTFTATNPFN